MTSRLVLPKEELENFMKNGAMNHQYGAQVFFLVDPEKAQELLPPPLKISDPPLGYFYAVNIREPTFGPWYMEAGIGLMATFENRLTGVYFTGLMLTGPGAHMGMCSGREGSGLPKKLGERIHVERLGDEAHIFVDRDGVRLVDIEMTMGKYNDERLAALNTDKDGCSSANPVHTEGGCLLYRYMMGNGDKPATNMFLNHYDSPTVFKQWDPATVKMTLKNGPNDFWGDIPVTEMLGGGWMVSDNYIRGQTRIADFTDDEARDILRYLLPGRFDQCTLYKEHQIYE